MSDLDTEAYYPQEVKKAGYVEALSEKFGVEIKLLTDEEVRLNIGPIAKSRNSLSVAKYDGKLCVLKRYQDGGHEESPERRAKTERKTLKDLEQKGYKAVPRLLSEKIVRDPYGDPVSAIEYVPDLYPASSLTPTITEEIFSDHETPTIDLIFFGLSEFHRQGYIHGDAHLGNIALRQENDDPPYMMLDVESAVPLDMSYGFEYTVYERGQDVEYLIADIVVAMAKEKGESVFDGDFTNLIDSIQRWYFRNLGDNANATEYVKRAIDQAYHIWQEYVTSI